VQGFCTKPPKKLAPGRGKIYRKKIPQQREFEDFYLPFGGRLRSDNRWVRLSKLIPWEEIEKGYAKHFAESGMGAPAKAARVALGALIIQEKLGLTDEEVVEQIRENPYLQYFIGYGEYSDEEPFEASMMVHFRKRLGLAELSGINELIHSKHWKQKHKERVQDQDKDRGDKGGGSGVGAPNRGKLIVDASVAPADIRYPTDLSLLNEAREKSEGIIDELHGPLKGEEKKVRTYRERARRDYLRTAKKRRVSGTELRKAIGKQLRYVRRDLQHIETLSEKSGLGFLSRKQYRDLLVIGEVYRQQEQMYGSGTKRIEGRIVSISQPHVRPIVRGKAGRPVEFGAKVSVSLVEGYTFIERMSWENFNESKELIGQIEGYRERFGWYPESVHADKIYRTRENLRYCEEHGIRLSGPKLGRPKKEIGTEEKAQMRQDELVRNAIEGKFGQGKRRFRLACIRGKLPETSGSMIALVFLLMNLEKLLKGVFLHFCRQWIISNILGYQGHFAYNGIG
jgi:IS5 family transposase